jgi:Mrp family chromosome partitioning ATPase
MSRIADVLKKARRDRGGLDPDLRTLDEIKVPWQFDEVQTPVPPVPPRASAAAVAPLPLPAPPPASEPAPDANDAQPADVSIDVDDETRALARQLFVRPNGGGNGARRLLLCPVQTRDSSSAIAAGLAAAMARDTSSSVCLMDLGFDGGTLHRSLGLDGSTGIAETVLQRLPPRACAQRIDSTSDLWFMPAGARCGELRELLGQTETRRAIRACAGGFDYVVSYAPVRANGGDAVILGECFDGVVLILDAKTTTADAARAASSAFEQAGVRVLGNIVNSRPDTATH